MPNALPRIAVTMGDPAGVGPEICLRMVQEPTVLERCLPIVFGDAGVLDRVAEYCQLTPIEQVLSPEQWPQRLAALDAPAVVDFRTIDALSIQPGTVDAATGHACYTYLTAAIDAALAGQVDAVTTGPMNKEALHAAGHYYPGHTEILAARTGAERSCMMLTSQVLTCSFVTTHVGYRDVIGQLNVERILEVIELSAAAMQSIRGRPPRLLVCGLNPHAGERGLFGGGEEETLIEPAVRAAQSQGIEVRGPLPPDTAFLPKRRAETDCVICMYHDQGHAPLKALAFDVAVNITLGLPIIRTSVDHGTACDIAWQGIASATSLTEAVLLAARMSGQKS